MKTLILIAIAAQQCMIIIYIILRICHSSFERVFKFLLDSTEYIDVKRCRAFRHSAKGKSFSLTQFAFGVSSFSSFHQNYPYCSASNPPTYNCPAVDGTYPNPNSACSTYFFYCSNGKSTCHVSLLCCNISHNLNGSSLSFFLKDCQPGLYYNPSIVACDYPSNIPGCSGATNPTIPTTRPPTTTRKPPATVTRPGILINRWKLIFSSQFISPVAIDYRWRLLWVSRRYEKMSYILVLGDNLINCILFVHFQLPKERQMENSPSITVKPFIHQSLEFKFE